VRLADYVAIDGAGLVFWKHDRRLGADTGTGGAVRFTVVLVLHLEPALFVYSIHTEEAEAQTLHAIRAAIVVDDGEPGLPLAVPDGARARAFGFHQIRHGRRVPIGNIVKAHRNGLPRIVSLRCAAIRESPEHDKRST